MRSSPKVLYLALAGLVSAQSCYIESTYKVVSGDTLGNIATGKNVTLAQVLEVNPLITNPDLIQIDQLIGVPNKECAPSDIPVPASCVGTSSYKVVSGDGLFNIATSKGLTLAQIEAANPQITNPDLIQVDQVIAIPPTTCVPATPTTSTACVGTSNYTVVSGDTLGAIATSKGVSLAQLRAANPDITNPDLILVGQVIAIPSPSCVVPTSTSTTSATASATPAPPSNCSSAGVPTYTVVSGDGFYNIAVNKLGVTVAALQAANPQVTDINVISVGQVLNVPLCNTTCVPKVASTYTVVSGDTLYQIAVAHNVTLETLEAVNPQITNPDVINAGDVVNIPSCSYPPTPVVPETATANCTSGNATYTIVSGDTLTKIAAAKGITLASLEAANPQIADFDVIYADQVINIPICGTCSPSGASTYTIVSGDTLSNIAASRSITLAALEAANPQIDNPDLIFPGQVIAIPVCGQPTPVINTPTCVPSGPSNYTVKAGDTFSAIAISFNVTLKAFTDANPQVADINKIEVGQVLNVPLCGTTYVAAPVEACPAPTKYVSSTANHQKKKQSYSSVKQASSRQVRSVDGKNVVVKAVAFKA